MLQRLSEIKEQVNGVEEWLSRWAKRSQKEGEILKPTILLIYKMISHPIVQLLATAFFTFYASGFCITEKGSINLLGVLVYFIVYLLFYIANNHRKKRAQETNLIEDVLQTQTTVIHQMREQMMDIYNGEEDSGTFLGKIVDDTVASIDSSLRDYYGYKEFKISVIQRTSDMQGEYCKMIAYNHAAGVPERHREKYYVERILNEKEGKKYPLFARLLSNDPSVTHIVGKHDEIWLKNREEVSEAFEDEQNRNTTQQCLGMVVKDGEDQAVLLFQICSSREDGFGSEADRENVLNRILIPNVKIAMLAYEIQRQYESEEGSYDEEGV